MSISEIDRLHSQLSRLEGMFPGYRTEIVEGNIVMSPVRPFHNRTIRKVWNQLEEQLPGGWDFISDVAFPFSGTNEFCPDLALIPRGEADRNLTAYPADLIELVVEVVSPGSVRNDYEVKVRRYGAQGIPDYVILDPTTGSCTRFWNPSADGYLGRDTVPYGKPVTLESAVGPLRIDTAGLPVDPEADSVDPEVR